MTIPRIRNINTIETYQIPDVANVYIPRWMTTQPNVDYLLPPVVINIGNPIVDIPGCVTVSYTHLTLPTSDLV